MTSQIPPRRQLRSRALQVLPPPLLLPLPLQRRPMLRQMRPLQVMQQLLLLLLPLLLLLLLLLLLRQAHMSFHGVFRCTLQVNTSQVTRHTLHMTRHTSKVTRHTSHVTQNRGTRHTSHVTRHTSHVTRHTSHVI